ncbi:MAG: DNA internalization-related competence protein ComEC/Rec2 [Candidatus Gastranaerophilaceae bacterium]
MEFSKTQKTLTICCIFIFAASGVLIGTEYLFLFLALIFLLFSAYKGLFSYKFVLVCLFVFIFSGFYTFYKTPNPDKLYYLAPSNEVLQGRIVSFPDQNDEKLKFELQCEYLIQNNQKIPLNAKTRVSIFDKEQKFDDFKIGNKITVSGMLKKPYKATNPDQFDYAQYLKNSNIFTVMYVKPHNYSLLNKPKSGKWFLIQKSGEIRDKILDIHKKFLKKANFEVLGGIVFGSTAINPSPEIKNDFINSGLYHLLAASGMNVGFVFAFWYFICNKISRSSKISIISGGLVVILYAIMTGLPPSVLRATGTIELMLLGRLLDRKSDNIVLLALICVMLLIYNPLLLNDIGFQLSFIVTFGLLFSVSPLMEKLKALPNWLSGAIVIPFVAQLWVAPIQIFHFNTFAPYSIIANIVVMPFNAIITFGGFIGSILALLPFIGTSLCFLADKITDPFVYFLLWVTEYFSKLPHSLLFFGKPLLIQLFIFYLLIIIAIFAIKIDFKTQKLNVLAGILFLFLLLFPVCKWFSQDLNLVFFNVGEGDSILIQTPEKKNILVDTGTYSKYGLDPAKISVVPYLRSEGIKRLDALVLTHPDSDHIGGTVSILENIKVDRIYTNGDTSKSKTYKNIQRELSQKHLITSILSNGNKINIDKKLEINVLDPENISKKSHNDTSLILLLKYKKFSTILMADNETNSLNLLNKSINNDVDIIKVGHHGSKKSLNSRMLNLLNPKVAVISVGKNNYGHPSHKIMNLLEQHDVKIFRTDDDNSIKINTDGKIFNVYSFDENLHKWKKRGSEEYAY